MQGDMAVQKTLVFGFTSLVVLSGVAFLAIAWLLA